MHFAPMSRRSFLKCGAAAGAAGLAGLPLNFRAFAADAGPDYFLNAFGVTDELCRKVLDRALSQGGDWADLYFEHTITNFIWLEDGKVSRAYSGVALGVGIRTVNRDQVGYGFTQELEEPSMLAAAATAASIANGQARTPAGEYVRMKTPDRYPLGPLADAPFETRLPIAQKFNDRCFARSQLVAKVNFGLNDEQKRILIVTSDGVKAADVLPHTYFFGIVTAAKDGRVETVISSKGSRSDLSMYTPDHLDSSADEAVDRTMILFDAIQPPAGDMPVVLGHGVPAVLVHEAIGHGLEADFNRKGISTYATMMGQKIAEPFVTIIDDATLPQGLGSINFDDEATPADRTVLVQNGILTSYMHDRISALHYGVDPTGNGRRQSYQHFVIPRMRNTYMAPGDSTPEEIIRSVPRGIYVQEVSNGEVAIGAGDFAFYVSQGRMIENGQLTAPIKDVNIMGNGPKMLRDMTMMASDVAMSDFGASYCGKFDQQVLVGLGMPTVLVKSLTVGGVQT